MRIDAHGQPLFLGQRDILRIANRNYDYFVGVARGIIADGNISPAELLVFKNLVLSELRSSHVCLADFSVNIIHEIAERIPSDVSLITQEMCEDFKDIFERVVGRISAPNETPSVFFNENVSVEFSGKRFCITGKSMRFASRKEFAEKISSLGGQVTGSVNARLDYLIVCGEKSAQWAYSTHGTKIEAALRLGIKIVSEFDVL